jgi:two-component system, OmpR family, sensor histidine kinase KdpD
MNGSAKVISFPTRARTGVMVCLSSNAAGGAQILLRKAYRTAAELDADWYAVHVDCEVADKTAPVDRDFRAMLDSVVLAADMGAEAVWLKAPDITEALLNFARDARVRRIIVGRARHGLGARLRKRSVTGELIERGREFEIEVVGLGRRGGKQG